MFITGYPACSFSGHLFGLLRIQLIEINTDHLPEAFRQHDMLGNHLRLNGSHVTPSGSASNPNSIMCCSSRQTRGTVTSDHVPFAVLFAELPRHFTEVDSVDMGSPVNGC